MSKRCPLTATVFKNIQAEVNESPLQDAGKQKYNSENKINKGKS